MKINYAKRELANIKDPDYFIKPDLDGLSGEDTVSLHKMHIKVIKGGKISS